MEIKIFLRLYLKDIAAIIEEIIPRFSLDVNQRDQRNYFPKWRLHSQVSRRLHQENNI